MRKPVRHPLLQRSSLLPLSLVCVMAGLLGSVAWLQYRWTRQVTAATEQRVGSNIESVMVDWHWDFYRQFSTICVALQVGPDSGAYDEWDVYRDRYWRWRNSAEYPRLVRGVYVFETSAHSAQRLLELPADQSSPREVGPSPLLQSLLFRLASRSGDLPTALRAWSLHPASAHSGSASPYSSLSGWLFDARVPALVHPLIHHSLPGDPPGQARVQAVDWLIVLLDLPTLQRQILPDLTRRYFRGGLNGPLTVVFEAAGPTPRILYASEPHAVSPEARHADAVMNVFGPPPQSTEGHLWEAVKNTNAVQPQEWHNFLGPVWFPIIHYSVQEDPWMLILRNPAGRLDQVVLRVRSSNFMISSVVLLLLAANVSLIALSALRANRFAQLQMDFVASISHELRTPLAALLSAGENLKDGVVRDERQLMRYGGIVTSQARQLIGLVDQILMFASTRNGGRSYHRNAVDIMPVIEAALRSSGTLIQSPGFAVEKQIAPDLPLAMADPVAVAQCLQNLITNALKYSGSSRWIRIAASRGQLRGAPAVSLSVQDRGMGISPGELGHIFKPFYRAAAVQAAQIHGTGLGLVVARRIAEDMGGTLSVRSELGAGSTFTLLLPAAETAAAEPEEQQAEAFV